MKKIYLLLMFSIFMISIVSSATQFKDGEIINTNDLNKVRVYDTVTKTAVISDKVGVPIVNVKLETELNEVVGVGYSKVAEFTLYPKQNYTEIINGFEFYDLNKNKKMIYRPLDLRYWGITKVLVNDYKKDCSNIDSKNLSKQYCGSVIVGNHLEDKKDWLPFNESVILNNPVRVALFTNVYLNDYIEWIPTIADARVTEWASWSAGLNSGLMSYYKFDETTGTNVSDIVRGRNGVSRYNDLWVLGKINNSMRFNYTNGVGNNFNNVNVTFSGTGGAIQTNTTENLSVTSWSVTGDTAEYGYQFTMGSYNMNITAVLKPSENTYTTWFLKYAGNGTTIQTGSFSGDWGTIPTTTLIAGGAYNITVYDGGAGANLAYKTSASNPIAGTNVTWNRAFGCSSSQYCAIQAINLSYSTAGATIIDGIGNFTDNGTFGGWVNSTNNTGLHFILGQKTVGVSNGLNININNGIVSCQVSGSGTTDSTTTIRSNALEHILCVKNTTNIMLYLNGVLNSTSTATNNFIMPNKTMYFGVYGESYYDNPALDGNWFSGNIDELAFWNRSLDVSEITELYNNGDGCSYQICFINSSITLLNPINNQYVITSPSMTSGTVNFSVIPTSSDTATNLNVTLYLYDSTASVKNAVSSNLSSFNNTQTNYSISISKSNSGHNFTWYAILNDSYGLHYSINRSFNLTIPDTYPIQLQNFSSTANNSLSIPNGTNQTMLHNESAFVLKLGDYFLIHPNQSISTVDLINITFLNPDTNIYETLSYNTSPIYPFNLSGAYPHPSSINTKFYISLQGTGTGLIGVHSYFEDYDINISVLVCKDFNCVVPNSSTEYINYMGGNGIFQLHDPTPSEVANQTNPSFITSTVGSLANIFPNYQDLTQGQRTSFVVIFILAITVVTLILGFRIGIVSLYIAFALDILFLIFFAGIRYISVGIIIFFALIGIAVLYLKGKSN